MDAPMSVDRCKENAVKIVNSKFGDNIKSLSDLKSFYLETKQTAETIENRVSIINHGLRTSCSPSSNFIKKKIGCYFIDLQFLTFKNLLICGAINTELSLDRLNLFL